MRSPNAAKRCLPCGGHVVEHAAVDEVGVGEAALRAGDRDRGRRRSGRCWSAGAGGAACGPPASESGGAADYGPRVGGRRRTRRSARRRWRGRGRSRSRTPAHRNDVAARGEPGAPVVGRLPLDATVGGPPLVHVSKPVARPAQRPAAGGDRRRRALPPAKRRAASCSRICGWASPPIVPNTAASSPSRVAIAGHSVCGGRRPGPARPDARLQAEAEPAVVEVDAGRRLDEPGAEARRRWTG